MGSGKTLENYLIKLVLDAVRNERFVDWVI
jgi:hypothetical protein